MELHKLLLLVSNQKLPTYLKPHKQKNLGKCFKLMCNLALSSESGSNWQTRL